MEKLRESEIRNESLQLVVETYRIVQILPEEADQRLKINFLNTSFKVSSVIANAFSALQNDEAEESIKTGLASIDDLKMNISILDKDKLAHENEFNRLKEIITLIQEDLESFLASIQIIKLDKFSPKLEVACI